MCHVSCVTSNISNVIFSSFFLTSYLEEGLVLRTINIFSWYKFAPVEATGTKFNSTFMFSFSQQSIVTSKYLYQIHIKIVNIDVKQAAPIVAVSVRVSQSEPNPV